MCIKRVLVERKDCETEESTKFEEDRVEEEEEEEGNRSSRRLLGDDKQVRELHRVLPLAGSGKIPWLRLLMTDDFGES